MIWRGFDAICVCPLIDHGQQPMKFILYIVSLLHVPFNMLENENCDVDKPKVRCSMKVNGWCSAFTLPHPFPWNSFIVKISCSYTGVVPGSTANSSWKLRWFPECFTHYKLVQHWKEKGWRKKRRTKRRNKSKIKPKNKTDYFMSFK